MIYSLIALTVVSFLVGVAIPVAGEDGKISDQFNNGVLCAAVFTGLTYAWILVYVVASKYFSLPTLVGGAV